MVISNTLTCLILSSLLSSLVAMACTMASYVDLLPALPESPVRETARCVVEKMLSSGSSYLQWMLSPMILAYLYLGGIKREKTKTQ